MHRSNTIPTQTHTKKVVSHLDGWETGNLEAARQASLRRRVHCRDDHVRLCRKGLGDIFIGRRKLLAVPAPRRKELDQDVLARVHGDRVKAGARERCHMGRRTLHTLLQARLVVHERHEVLRGATALVVFWAQGPRGKPLERGETAHAVLGPKLLVGIRIHLGNHHSV